MKKILYSRLCWILSLLLILSFQNVVAQDFILDVGETGTVPTPKLASDKAYFAGFQGLGSSDKDLVEPINSTTFRVKKWFSGTVRISSFYSYYVMVKVYLGMGQYGETPQYGNGTAYYTVKCKGTGNDITLKTPKTTLVCGETVQLTYSFEHYYSGTPTVSYRSSSNCVTVSNSGLVTAKSPGTATITASSDLGANESSVTITVKEETPTAVEVTPKETTILLDESQKLSFEVKPFGTVQTVTWSVENGKEGLMSVDANGVVTASTQGQGKVIATTKNGYSDYCLVTLKEPTTTMTESSPANNATDVSVFVSPNVTFTHPILQGDNFDSITLLSDNGTMVEGTALIYGNTVVFNPSYSLNALTGYTLTIPSNAIKNKWGTNLSENFSVRFSTRSKEKLVLALPPNDVFYKVGDKLELKCSNEQADIYYTMDGTSPTTSSLKYKKPIEIQNSFKLKAVAMLDGYENSDIMEQDYFISNICVVSRFPDVEKLAIYKDVNPNVRFNNEIKASREIEGITLKNVVGFEKGCEIYVADSTIYLVPATELGIGETYTVNIPANAILTIDGEPNDEYEWTFNTGDYATAISMGANELGSALKMDASLKTWGNLFVEGNAADYSATFESKPTPETFIDCNVIKTSSGYMHHAAIMIDGSLWMWGRQHCGEFGNNSYKGSAVPVKIMDDVLDVSAGGQTTAIIKEDHTLWMCGRNDFGQIGNGSYDVCKSPVKIMDDVKMAVAGWCSSFALKADGTLWAWGRNDNHQLGDGTDSLRRKPVQILEDVALVEASATESGMFAAVKTDGSLWVWGGDKAFPQNVATDVCSVAVGTGYVEYVKTDGTLWAYGDNSFGQLGTGDTTASTSPVKIMEGVAEVASGGQTTMALKEDGSVWTWGRNYAGALGMKSPEPSATAFAPTPGCIIEGIASSALQGIRCRKDIAIVDGYMSVVEMFPVPLNARYDHLDWKSSDEKIVTVDNRGVISAEARGRSDVTCTISDVEGKSYSAVCHVFVGTPQEVNIDDVLADNSNNVKVWSSNQTIYVDGLSYGQIVSVYDLGGHLLFSDKAETRMMQIPLAKSDVYIVRTNNKSYKLLCK